MLLSPYSEEDVVRVLGWLANGGPWREETAPPPGMPKAPTDPSKHGSQMAEMADVRNALHALWEDAAHVARIVCLRYGPEQLSLPEIAERTGYGNAGHLLDMGTKMLADYANRGHRREQLTANLEVGLAYAKPPKAGDPMPFPWVEVDEVDESLPWGGQCPTCHLTMPTVNTCDECEENRDDEDDH